MHPGHVGGFGGFDADGAVFETPQSSGGTDMSFAAKRKGSGWGLPRS